MRLCVKNFQGTCLAIVVCVLFGINPQAGWPESVTVDERLRDVIDAINSLQELPVSGEEIDAWFQDETHPLRVRVESIEEEIHSLEQQIKQLNVVRDEVRSLLDTLDRAREVIHLFVEKEPIAVPPAEATPIVHPGWTVIESSCLECHGPQSPAGKLDLTTREALMAGGERGDALVPGDPENSLLYQMVAHETEPAMPFFADPLPDEQVAQIADWIRDGAPYPATTAVADEPTKETIVAYDDSHDGVIFERDIYPVLEQSCLGCHGPGQQMGMLRLDAKTIAFKGGLHGPAIVPGDPEASVLYQRLIAEDEGLRMPLGGEPLSPETIDAFHQWIVDGAVWPENVGVALTEVEKHWAYIAPELPERPTVSDEHWVRNPIDRFVLDQLDELGLEPAPEADRETLLRRVSLDLTGLPPTLEEREQFLEDDSPRAYENLVNRLLASPHYGERWAVPWLDQARYADSHGYEKDGFRVMWPYRQWVIESYNRDQPFDQFTIEQIAGDMLPGANLDQRIATGFHRNTMINLEGGVVQEEYRIAAVMDRVNTTSTVWLGTTMACAQCHNHKYDPFTQQEYYEFMAFLNNSAGEIRQIQSFSAVEDSPKVRVPTLEQQLVIQELDRELEALEQAYWSRTPELTEARQAWEDQVLADAVDWVPLTPAAVESVRGATLTVLNDASVHASGVTPATDTYVIRVELPSVMATAIRVEALTDERLPSNGPGRTGHANFVLSELDVFLDDHEYGLPLCNASTNFDAEDYEIAKAIDGDPSTGWAIHPRKGEPFSGVFEFDTQLSSEEPVTLTIRMKQWHGTQHVLGRFRISLTNDSLPVRATTIPQAIYDLVQIPEDMRETEQAAEIEAYFRRMTPLLAEVREQMDAVQEQWPDDIATTMVMRERDEPRETRIFAAGSYLNPVEQVYPGVPSVLHALPADQPADRLALARWLVDKENPLTARVTVNRIWEQIFGHGIVKTTEDFGTRSPAPVNPELLDWLAVQFMKHGWSQKSLLYLIVTSSAYRQSSEVTAEKLEADPENRYLTRGARFRLPAEFIRDQALVVSGKLNRKLGGPSVFPFQPQGIWQMPYSSAKWVMDDDGNQYRRGLYTHWQRTAPYPAFVTFDAPSREVSCSRRIRTNTPLQALVVLNDPAFFSLAQGLAVRMQTEAEPTPHARIRHGFLATLSREPTTREALRLKELYTEQYEYYKRNPEEAKEVLTDSGDGYDRIERAALTIVANVLLNLDETISKG